MHLHTVYMYMGYSECLPTRLTPLAEGSCFSQAARLLLDGGADPNPPAGKGASKGAPPAPLSRLQQMQAERLRKTRSPPPPPRSALAARHGLWRQTQGS